MKKEVAGCPEVDVLVLCRPHTRPPRQTIEPIESQNGVSVRLHVGVGWPERGDPNRWAAIARGRNELKTRGRSPWVMFVDDDVVLDPDCVRILVRALEHHAGLGAVGSDYNGEASRRGWSGHVAMGACLFRRAALDAIEFRHEPQRCECGCAADDLKAAGWGVTYSRHARSFHRKSASQRFGGKPSQPGVVLAAFDRRDVHRFEHQFLRSLRSAGNHEKVVAVGYGLYPSEVRRLRALTGVEVHWRPSDRHWVPVRRLKDFGDLVSGFPADQPVAYWDVSDVIFQCRLDSLWASVAETPDRILAVVEPKGYPWNEVIKPWTFSIHHPQWRRRAFELLQTHPFLNSGFSAGTARSMLVYFRHAHRMRHGEELSGSVDWGDQMCLNLYCHLDPARWRRVDEHWNFCVHDRPRGEVFVSPEGIIHSRRRGRIGIAHGNARSLRQFSPSLI